MKPIHWPRSKWSRAIPTHVGEIRFPSKLEARVFSYLVAHLRPEERLFRQISISLLSIASGPDGKALRFTVDFAVVRNGHPPRFIEAKGGRRSRDFELRWRAAQTTWNGAEWFLWDGNGEPPWKEGA